MKKLMFAACAVALATVAQAASVDWQVSGVQPDDQYQVGWCFISNNGGDDSISEVSVAQVLSLVSARNWEGVAALANDITIEPVGGEASSSESVVSTVWGTGGQAKPSTVEGFAILFDTDYFESIDEATQYMVVTDGGTATFETTSANKTFYLDATTSTWKDISDVPEPTSGLLLLVGLGALALRRRRA